MNVTQVIKKINIRKNKVFVILALSLLACFILFNPIKSFIKKQIFIGKIEKTEKQYLIPSELLLYKFVIKDDVKSIRISIKNNPEIISHSFTNDRYFSILHFASMTNHFNALKELLNLGYNPNVQDQTGKTVLHKVVNYKTWLFYKPEQFPSKAKKFVDLLLDYGADSDIYDDGLNTPLIIATQYGFDIKIFSLPKTLIEKGKCNINLTDKNGYSALFYALSDKDIYFAHYLICEKNVDFLSGFDSTKTLDFLLQKLSYPLDSTEYRLKKEIISKIEEIKY